jgi:hypothetical protein
MNGALGVHEPEIRVRFSPREERVERKALMSEGVISKSPFSSRLQRGFGSEFEKGASCAGSVLAHVRRRFGNVTSLRTDAL